LLYSKNRKYGKPITFYHFVTRRRSFPFGGIIQKKKSSFYEMSQKTLDITLTHWYTCKHTECFV